MLSSKRLYFIITTPLERVIGIAILKDALHSPAIYAFLDALRSQGKFLQKQAV